MPLPTDDAGFQKVFDATLNELRRGVPGIKVVNRLVLEGWPLATAQEMVADAENMDRPRRALKAALMICAGVLMMLLGCVAVLYLQSSAVNSLIRVRAMCYAIPTLGLVFFVLGWLQWLRNRGQIRK